MKPYQDKHSYWISAPRSASRTSFAGMTSLNTVMPAQAGIQFIFEEVAYDLEKGQIAKNL